MLRTVVHLSLLLAVLGQHVPTQRTAQQVADKKCGDFIEHSIRWDHVWLQGIISTSQRMSVLRFRFSNYCKNQTVEEGVALHGEFPHHALLGCKFCSDEKYEFWCGGSLISDRFVLTAAHCRIPEIVRLAEVDLLEAKDGQDIDVAGFIRHPDYKMSASYHDIALVQLDHKIVFSAVMRPACLWTSQLLNHSKVMATGFGAMQYKGNQSTMLMKASLTVRDKSICRWKFDFDRKLRQGIKDEQLCVGNEEGGRDTCCGDSGGPIQVLIYPKHCVYHVVGVTLRGAPCGIGDTASVYTAVAFYLDWIVDTVWPGERNDPVGEGERNEADY